MALISMRVELANETDATLSLTRSELRRGGEWADGKSPPRVIAPRATATWHAEAGSIVTGIEGSATFSTGAPNQESIAIGWNSPLVESAYGNTFPTSIPPGWDVALSGGQGRAAVLKVRVRRTGKRRVPDFVPSVCGLGFRNSWSGDLPVMTLGFIFNELSRRLTGGVIDQLGIRLLSDAALPVTRADQGVCGGMVFGVMDYYHAHLLPPADGSAPETDNVLFRFLRDRLRDSFDFDGSGERWLVYSAPLYPDGDEGVRQGLGVFLGRSWVTYRQEWPRIRDAIDAGRLVPLGLVRTKKMAIGDNHTVLAYAYEASGSAVRLWIYDPNDDPRRRDRDNLCLEFDTGSTEIPVAVSRTRNGVDAPDKPIACMFAVGGYAPAVPVGGRPADAMTFRQAHLREVGALPSGGIPADLNVRDRPLQVRGWMRSMGP